MSRPEPHLRIFLDDERETPEGWIRCYWPHEVIEHLKTGAVAELSLDHDLGDDKRGTGYDVITWIEARLFLAPWEQFAPPSLEEMDEYCRFRAPKIVVHSGNSPGRDRMVAGIESIERYAKIREDRFVAMLTMNQTFGKMGAPPIDEADEKLVDDLVAERTAGLRSRPIREKK